VKYETLEMKTVIAIKTLSPIKVPQEWIQCSVCGEYSSPTEYRKPDQENQSRTNCTSCYEMQWNDMKALQQRTADIMKSWQYINVCNELKMGVTYKRSSISVEDMIYMLQKLPANSRLIMTQEGYYANGSLADIHDPVIDKTIDDIIYYAIGHSSQTY